MMEQSYPVVIFDGVCNLCEQSVNFIIRHDRNGRFRFVSAQSETGRVLQQHYGVDAMADETVILIKDGKAYTRSDAAMEIARDLDDAWQWLAVGRFVPARIRNPLYSAIARNRYRWFGKKDQCLMPDADIKSRFII
jgi:predicted DCC family thiol-disulfide oxidoreductase YuxK